MAKKKSNRKWNKVNYFARKKSTDRKVGHPVLIYGKNGRYRKYLTFTHTPEKGKESKYEKLKYNIDSTAPKSEKSYVKKFFDISEETSFREPDKQYRIHEKDKETIKKYKK